MQRYTIRNSKLWFHKKEVEVIERVQNITPDVFTTSIGCIEKTYTKQPNGTYLIKERLNLDPIEIDFVD